MKTLRELIIALDITILFLFLLNSISFTQKMEVNHGIIF